MGLFLQKTNIIRDYLEDLDSGRTFWPDEIWYAALCDLVLLKPVRRIPHIAHIARIRDSSC